MEKICCSHLNSSITNINSKIGQIVSSSFDTERSVGAKTETIGSITLSKGVWIVIGEIRYSKASTRVFCRVSWDGLIYTGAEGTSSVTCTTPPMRIQATRIITVSQNSAAVSLYGYSDEPSNGATGLLRAVRII